MIPPSPDDYEVLASHSRSTLASEVRNKLNQGFALHGDLIVVTTTDRLLYVQAVARYYEYGYEYVNAQLIKPEGL